MSGIIDDQIEPAATGKLDGSVKYRDVTLITFDKSYPVMRDKFRRDVAQINSDNSGIREVVVPNEQRYATGDAKL